MIPFILKFFIIIIINIKQEYYHRNLINETTVNYLKVTATYLNKVSTPNGNQVAVSARLTHRELPAEVQARPVLGMHLIVQ